MKAKSEHRAIAYSKILVAVLFVGIVILGLAAQTVAATEETAMPTSDCKKTVQATIQSEIVTVQKEENEKVQEAVQETENQTEPKKAKKETGKAVWSSISVVIMVGAILGIVILLFQRKKTRKR